METFFFLSGIGLLIMFCCVGFGVIYRSVTSDRPLINQTNIRTTNIYKKEKDDSK